MTDLLKPLADRVVIKPAEPESVSKGGIVIPDVAKEKSVRGTVVAVGAGKYMEVVLGDSRVPCQPLTVRVGDTVLFERYAGSEVEIDGTTYKIVRESDILAVLGGA